MARSYDMSKRARMAARTMERIVSSAEALLSERPIEMVTLQAIAKGAGVTVQTVLRHVGSREGCFEAVRERVAARVDEQRGHTPPGDVDAAVRDVLSHYEVEGRLMLNLLAQSSPPPFVRDALESGRAYHRDWVEGCFGPLLTADAEARERTVDALVVATDLYTWKLLRLDLGRSEDVVGAVITRLVTAVLEAS